MLKLTSVVPLLMVNNKLCKCFDSAAEEEEKERSPPLLVVAANELQ